MASQTLSPVGRTGAYPVRVLAWTAVVLLTVVLAVQAWYLGHILWWTRVDPPDTRFMREALAELRETRQDARLRHRWVSYDRISPHLKRAVIAAEDANFTQHDGVDWDAIERAYDQNLKRGRVVRGGSTISMQLAKNLFLTGERSYLRKGQELAITFMLEAAMDKARILEIYLNVAQWGGDVFGCEAAARHYFGVGAAELSPAQAARLAAMLPRPRYYETRRGDPGLARRAALVQRGMGSVELP